MTDPDAITKRAVAMLEPLCVDDEQKQALFILSASISTLRETTLDLSRVLMKWKFDCLCLLDDGTFEIMLVRKDAQHPHDFDHPEFRSIGIGPTPSAALSAAIDRANEHGAKL